MTNSIQAKPHYAMFSDEGNAAVHALVIFAQTAKLSWLQVHKLLEVLAEDEKYTEATDTAVREFVYETLGF